MFVMNYKCEVCLYTLTYLWTDLHGEGCCTICGTPYQIIHYDENGNKVVQSPEMNVPDEIVQYVHDYWEVKGTSNGLGVFMENPYQDQLDAFINFIYEVNDG